MFPIPFILFRFQLKLWSITSPLLDRHQHWLFAHHVAKVFKPDWNMNLQHELTYLRLDCVCCSMFFHSQFTVLSFILIAINFFQVLFVLLYSILHGFMSKWKPLLSKLWNIHWNLCTLNIQFSLTYRKNLIFLMWIKDSAQSVPIIFYCLLVLLCPSLLK